MNDTETALSSAYEDCVIHCLWVTYTTPLWANTGAQGWFFNRSIGPDRGGVEREGEREEAAMFESVTEQSRTINHSFSPVIICWRSFVLNSSSRSIVDSFFPDLAEGGPSREPHCRRSSATIVQSHSIISMCMCKQNLLNLFPLFFES